MKMRREAGKRSYALDKSRLYKRGVKRAETNSADTVYSVHPAKNISKIHAAEMVTGRGIEMIVANGKNPSVLYDILEGGGVCTRFKPTNSSQED